MEHQISIKYSDDIEAILDQLQERWGCTKTEAARKAIVLAVERQSEPAAAIDLTEIEYALMQIRKNMESISNSQAELLESAKSHHDNNLHAHLMLLRQAGQTTYAVHQLTAKEGLYNAVKEKFTAWWPGAQEDMKNGK